MEVQIKKAVKAGNSSAVILPRSWLNREVRVELIQKTPETMLAEIINIIRKYLQIKEVIGIYLTGSYARGEEDKDSDIDILVITNNIDKEMIHEGIYNILIVSSELLNQKLAQDIFPLGPMLKEAKTLLNQVYLDALRVKITNKNIKWYLETTEDKLKLIERVIEKEKGKKLISDSVAYTLILRIRTLYIIKKLMENKDYSKKEFLKLINKVSGGANAYNSYLIVKNNLKDKRGISLEETKELYNYLKKQLVEIKSLLKEL